MFVAMRFHVFLVSVTPTCNICVDLTRAITDRSDGTSGQLEYSSTASIILAITTFP